MITPHPTAPDGAVLRLASYAPADFSGDVAVLCRNNAPLVTHAFAAIRRNVPVRILGRELGQGLLKTLKALKATDVADLCRVRLPAWFAREIKKCKKPAQRAALEDKYECLRAVAAEAISLADVETKITTLFVAAATPGALTLATGHKAKGQEWDKVFILDEHLIPSRWCDSAEDLAQERNLLYVMVTRAKLTLTYIKSDSWK